jgi:hypothetical protein
VCLLTDRFAEAGEHVAAGWVLREDGGAYVSARLLCQRIILALLDGAPLAADPLRLLLGRLKTVLQQPEAHEDWNMAPVLEHLKPRLSEDAYGFLNALVAALSERAHLPALEAFPAWREAEPQPLA